MISAPFAEKDISFMKTDSAYIRVQTVFEKTPTAGRANVVPTIVSVAALIISVMNVMRSITYQEVPVNSHAI